MKICSGPGLLIITALFFLATLLLSPVSTPEAPLLTLSRPPKKVSPPAAHHPTKTGHASWLRYQQDDTCATRDWKRGTKLRIVHTITRAEALCVVRDYGPDASVFPDRIVDLNYKTFAQLAPLSVGVIPVEVTPIF